jgi:perosamine synthetase
MGEKKEEKLAIKGGTPVRTTPFPPWPNYGEEEILAATEVLQSGKFARQSGSKVNEFERAFADYFGVQHAIAISSGTAAIHVALSALGIGPGDDVINTSHCFIGTATPVVHAGAVPVFADIDPDTFNIDPVSIKEKITPYTKAIIPVHLNGLPADMDPIMEIAREHNLFVVEDAAQAHGALYKGKLVGTIGDVGCFSFWEDKLMTTAGEGGMVIINNDELYQRAKMFHSHGELEKDGAYYKSERLYHHTILGYNFRMTEVQAAIGLVQLSRLDGYIKQRRHIAHTLTEGLSSIEGVIPPREPDYTKHVFYKYILKLDRKVIKVPVKRFIDTLAAEGIPCSRRYPTPLHQQPIFVEHSGFGDTTFPFTKPAYKGKTEYGGGLPNSEQLPEDLVRLVIRPTMSVDDIDDIISAVRKVATYFKENSLDD